MTTSSLLLLSYQHVAAGIADDESSSALDPNWEGAGSGVGTPHPPAKGIAVAKASPRSRTRALASTLPSPRRTPAAEIEMREVDAAVLLTLIASEQLLLERQTRDEAEAMRAVEVLLATGAGTMRKLAIEDAGLKQTAERTSRKAEDIQGRVSQLLNANRSLRDMVDE
ncbi:hypothetical protein T492DRAFT_834556 [Pavlovales sp. CCMP2436]|nr:hypothetical protein T492DRAFT_834556 [Pavlovales sp. CCMP2436]